MNSFSQILSSFPVIYIGKANPVPLNPLLPETEIFIFMTSLDVFSTYKIGFETVSGVEREVILWEREKRRQGHLLWCRLAQAAVRHQTMAGHPGEERGMAVGRLGMAVALFFQGTLVPIILQT